MNALRTAFAYFSIFPVGFTAAPRAGALAALPFVGIVVGGVAGLAGWLASFVMPLPLAIATAFGANIVLSGAIHLDGFLDTCDALFASIPPERRLEILKDPRHGTFALSGLAIVVPAWLGAIALLPPAAWPWTFAFCAGTARGAAVLNAWRVPYAAGGASARAFEDRPGSVPLALGLFAAALGCWMHPWLAVLVFPAAAIALLLGAWCAARLDGVLVGDCYGAIIVFLEVTLLAAIASLLAR